MPTAIAGKQPSQPSVCRCSSSYILKTALYYELPQSSSRVIHNRAVNYNINGLVTKAGGLRLKHLPTRHKPTATPMRRSELLFGYGIIIIISIFIGALTYDKANPSKLIENLKLPALLLVAMSVILTLANFASKSSNLTTQPTHGPEASLPSSYGVVQDDSALLKGLSRIEDRLAKLESIKPVTSHNPAQALAELRELQAKAYSEIQSALAELKNRPAANPSEVPAPADDKLGELSGALSEAMKEISRRDGTIDTLAANVTRTNIQRVLARVTQSLEVTRALQARVVDGKSSAAESFEFLVDDMDSALADQGVEHMDIAVGARVADLPAGSFAAISVVEAPEDSLRGTVKEVRSRSYFIAEEGKKPRYIAPAKVILYRA